MRARLSAISLADIQKHLAKIIILAPMAVLLIYLAIFSQPRYMSESKVAIKRSDDLNSGSLNFGLLLGASNPSSAEDALYLKEYINSPDMLATLDKQLNFREAFSHSGLDFLNHLSKDETAEGFLKYYKDRINVSYDDKTADSPLRDALTAAAARQVTRMTGNGNEWMPIGKMIDEKVVVNGIVALLATGGSTNHTMHLVAMARAAGIQINWDDFSDLSDVVPLMARLYPNGPADINHFQAAGGVPVLVRELLKAGLLHEDVNTVAGFGLSRYTLEPWLNNGELDWREGAEKSLDSNVIASFEQPFSHHGGTKVLSGNLGRAVMKTSAVPVENQVIEAPAVVFESQHDVMPAFEAGLLDRDCVVVVRHQGPKANGMPELHKLMPPLGVLLDRCFKIALVTDGRLSGASGKVPSAIHVTPEAYDGGLLAKVRDGDIIRVNGQTGELTLLVDEAELAAREPHIPDLSASRVGTGRELFSALREKLSGESLLSGRVVTAGSLAETHFALRRTGGNDGGKLHRCPASRRAADYCGDLPP